MFFISFLNVWFIFSDYIPNIHVLASDSTSLWSFFLTDFPKCSLLFIACHGQTCNFEILINLIGQIILRFVFTNISCHSKLVFFHPVKFGVLDDSLYLILAINSLVVSV